MSKITDLVKRHQLVAFFALTYAITWGLWLPFAGLYFRQGQFFAAILVGWGLFGPALAGILITRLNHPDPKEGSRRASRLALLAGLIVSTIVVVLNSLVFSTVGWTPRFALGAAVMGAIGSIPPALVISSAFSRNWGVRRYLAALVKPRGSPVYYVAALFIPLVAFWLGSAISTLVDQPAYTSPAPLVGWNGAAIVSIAFVFQFFFANTVGEEVGWRGFALPRLQARLSPVIASLVLALLWYFWHLPLKWASPDELPYLFHGLTFIPQSIFLAWLANRTGGSILVVGLAQVANNVGGKWLFPVTDAWLGVSMAIALILIVADRMWQKLPSDSATVVPHATLQPSDLLQDGEMDHASA